MTEMEMQTAMAMHRTPSYFVWPNRKHASSSPRHSTPRSRKQGMTTNSNMNARSSPGLQDVSTDGISSRDGGGDDSGPSPSKMRSPHPRSSGVGATDTQSVDTRLSGVSGESDSHTQSAVSISPKHKDPDRIKKDREREERVRLARERLEEERKKKLVELQEQQRQAQENREKQLEMRRQKIEDLRRRDIERRAAVEERRRAKEDADRSRRETLLIKAEERVARYEQWRRTGQKGSMPTPKHLSVSTSVLYHKRNTDFSSAGMLNISSRPESLVALNTIPEGRRSFLAAMGQLPSRPKSVMTLSGSSTGSASSVVPGGGVRLRETKTPRKPRPASVATSMPSFVAFEPARPSPRSKSSDRLARERSKTRVKSARQSAEKEDEKVEEGKEIVKTVVKTSRGTIDRLSTPKQSPSAQGKETATAKRESPVRISPRKAFSTTNLTVPRKKPSIKERPTKEASGKPKHPTPAAVAAAALEDASPPAPVVASTSAATATPTSASATRTPTRVQSPVLAADEDGGSGRPLQTATPGSAGEITAEEYKAKLAEKRRQAREKAEREAEEERRRQEEIQRQEEERRRQEEEDQRRLEEEALRLAEEGRKAEEERLRKAIEAEEQRRAEEAARLEQERLAKEESERKAKEEAERLEQEKLEKARRDEEERLERKKRLEMIMKRVKTDAPVEGTKETPIKTVTGSPTKNMSSNSSDSSPTEPESKGMPEASPAPSVKQDEAEPRSENIESEESQPLVSASLPEEHTQAPHTKEPDSATVSFIEEEKAEPSVLAQNSMMFSTMYSPVAASVEADNGGEKPKFKSPLLQKLVEGKEDAGVGQASGGTRFKSPLLQNLLGKTKVGARIGIDRQDHSVSTPDLSSLDRSGASGEARGRGLQPASDAMSASMVEVGGGDASSRKEVMNNSEEKDVDTSEDSSSSSHSSPSHSSSKSARMVANGDGLETSPPLKTVSFVEPIQQTPANGNEEAMDVSGIVDASAHVDMASSGASFWSEQDSGASFGSDSIRPGASASPLQLSLNGHGLVPHSRLEHSGLEDSSISMRSVESGTTSITDSATGSIFSSVSSLQQSQVQLSVGGDRDFEELIDLTISKKSATSDASDDLINYNKFEDGSEKTSTVPPPIIAFEEPATAIRCQDVKDLLS